MKAYFALLLGLMAQCIAYSDEYAPAFYPFKNGMRFATAEEGVRVIKDLGYPGVGSIHPGELAQYKTACDAAGLKVFSIYCSARVNEKDFQYAPVVSEAIALLKGTDAIVELNVQRGQNSTDEIAVALVKEIADKAKAAGLKVALYPHLNDHIERVDHAVRIAKASGCDNVGVAFNLCHFLKCQPGDDVTAALKAAQPLLWSVSICGADKDGKDWKTLIRPLDEGTFDQVALLRSLRDVGYRGPVGMQCFNIGIDAKENLTRSQQAWRKNLAALR
jgi:sugar phosphate isomerase/epimerase